MEILNLVQLKLLTVRIWKFKCYELLTLICSVEISHSLDLLTLDPNSDHWSKTALIHKINITSLKIPCSNSLQVIEIVIIASTNYSIIKVQDLLIISNIFFRKLTKKSYFLSYFDSLWKLKYMHCWQCFQLLCHPPKPMICV